MTTDIKGVDLATIQDIDHVLDNLRTPDVVELEDGGWEISEYRESLFKAFDDLDTYAFYDSSGVPYGIGGVASHPIDPGIGIPWCHLTDGIDTNRIRFARSSKALLEQLSAPYRKLENHTHARNGEHLQWLKWLGFDLQPGDDIHPFINFHKYL